MLAARIVSRRPLTYRRGADPSIDRPAHVRAASGLTYVGDALCVIQDDAAFLGVIDLATGLVDDTPLPARQGRRVFESRLGNKPEKPDLEAAFGDGDTLIAFGSGGPLEARRVIVTWRPGNAPRVIDAGALLDAIATAALPGATSLNLEGAAIVGDAVWIANRGGDHAGGDVSPDAIIAIERAAFHAHLDGGPVPPLTVTIHDLGTLDGAALRFTDLATAPSGALYLASAEATTTFFDDGAVVGSVLGVIGGASAEIVDATGRRVHDKVEGVTLVPGRRDRALAVVDADDPDRHADLLELALDGDWFG